MSVAGLEGLAIRSFRAMLSDRVGGRSRGGPRLRTAHRLQACGEAQELWIRPVMLALLVRLVRLCQLCRLGPLVRPLLCGNDERDVDERDGGERFCARL